MHLLKIRFMAVLLAVALMACSAFTGQVAQIDDPLLDGAAPGDQTEKPGLPPVSAPAQAGKKFDAAPRAASPVLKGTPVQSASRQMDGTGKDAVSEKSMSAGSDTAGSQGRGAMIALNFDNADIFEVINALSDFLDINYIIDPAIKGKVNIHTTSEVDKRQLLSILETIFEMNNVSVVKQGEFYKILPSKDAQKQGVQVGIGRDIDKPDSPDRMAIQIIPLKYVPSAEVVKVIKPFSSKNGEMVEFTKTNIIILFDTVANIQKIVTLVNVIDSDAFENNEIRFFKVKNANVLDLAKELEGIYTSLGIEKADGKKGVGLAVVPVERASIVVAVSPIPGVLDQMQHWVDVLDTIDKDADEQIFIYFVENGKSEEIADILVQLYGGEASSSLSEKRSQRGQGRNRDSSSKWSSASGQRRSSSSGTGDDSRSSSSSRTRSSATSAKAKTSTILENNIMIVTDEATNSIIVRSNSQDYAKIRETIQRLDIIPRQVLIEVFIGEVGLSGDTQFGVEWALLQNNDKLGGYKGSGKTGQNFGAGLDAALDPTAAASVGFTYLFQSDRLQAFLIAQASNNKLNILSTPNIIASDNKEARIEVGEEVPIVTSEYVPLYTGFDGGTGTGSNNFNSTSRSIEYRNTGIILEVTPRINEKGLVALDISQEVSKAQPITASGIQSPTITNRLAETSVVVQDGKTVVIGGIINNEASTTQSGIPYLSKIPLLGYLFSNTSDGTSKRELIIMLTPHVIKDIGEAAAVTDEYKSKMTEIRRLLQRDEGKWAKSYQ